MEQRPLRLGDIVDDYCPRERRLTNHAIVAIVEHEVRQTRCATCGAEHVYKHGREPLRRKKDDGSFEQVLAEVAGSQLIATKMPDAAAGSSTGDEGRDAAAAEPAPDGAAETGAVDGHHDDAWPAHRRLIRASLPRVEGEPPAPRPIPEFTMHQRPQGRGFRPHRFSSGQGGGAERNGNVAHPRHDGRPGQGGNGHAGGPGGRPRPDGQAQRPGRRRGRHKHSR